MLNKEKKVQRTSKSGNDAKPIVTRRAVLLNRIHKLNIIRNDIYPKDFNRVNRLIIKNERKVLIIDKLLGW